MRHYSPGQISPSRNRVPHITQCSNLHFSQCDTLHLPFNVLPLAPELASAEMHGAGQTSELSF